MSEAFPDQPLYVDSDGCARFRENRIVRFMLSVCREHGVNLSVIGAMTADGSYSNEEFAQLAQLIGYSVYGFGELSVNPREIVERCDKKAEELLKKEGSDE